MFGLKTRRNGVFFSENAVILSTTPANGCSLGRKMIASIAHLGLCLLRRWRAEVSCLVTQTVPVPMVLCAEWAFLA